MILAGDYIEQSIGFTLGISTMAAAALGVLVADVIGLGVSMTTYTRHDVNLNHTTGEALELKLADRSDCLSGCTVTISSGFICANMPGCCLRLVA